MAAGISGSCSTITGLLPLAFSIRGLLYSDGVTEDLDPKSSRVAHLVVLVSPTKEDSFARDVEGAGLKRATEFFGVDRALETIRVSDVRAWSAHLLATKGKTGKRLGPESVRRHLFTLSAVYRFAQEGELLPPGFNPVSAFTEKPPRGQSEAKWLEVPDAALLLESARTLPTIETPAGDAIGAEVAYPLLATFLLTGGRRAEVLGLELDDLSFDRQIITIRPNAFRRLKTRTSWRVVPLCPQLAEIIRAYVFGQRLERGGRLLFPSFASGEERMLVDVRKLVDRIAVRAGWKKGELTTRVFRHTWTAARLQTLDHGAPVSVYTVSRELGHGSEEMVRRVCAHLGAVRHRSEVVEFRIEQHLEALKDRLGNVGFVTRNVTAEGQGTGNENPATSELEAGEGLPEWARRDSNARPLAPEASALSN
jgi:integrase